LKLWIKLQENQHLGLIKGQIEETHNDLFEKDAKHRWLNLVENKGKFEANWKLNSQLKINLHKSKIKDQNEKALNFKVDI
jgi:hypothetical protein